MAVETNESGVYSFSNLPPGRYHVEARASGFRDLRTEVFEAPAFRANMYSVPRHQWQNQILYDLPFGGSLGLARTMLRGWQLNALLNLQTGHFLNRLVGEICG